MQQVQAVLVQILTKGVLKLGSGLVWLIQLRDPCPS